MRPLLFERINQDGQKAPLLSAACRQAVVMVEHEP